MLGCCRNFWGDFGANAFQDGLHEAINSEKMQYARSMLTGKNLEREDIPCTTCDIYIDMKARGKFLNVDPFTRLGRLAARLRRKVVRTLETSSR